MKYALLLLLPSCLSPHTIHYSDRSGAHTVEVMATDGIRASPAYRHGHISLRWSDANCARCGGWVGMGVREYEIKRGDHPAAPDQD